MRFKIDVRPSPWWSLKPPTIVVVNTKSDLALPCGDVYSALSLRDVLEQISSQDIFASSPKKLDKWL